MKVLKDNHSKTNVKNNIKPTKQYPIELVCEGCNSSLEYEESDMKVGEYGLMYVDCPLCGYKNYIDDECIDLTIDNIEFPTHFSHTSIDTGAVDCCNNETIKKYIREAINYLRKNKNEYEWNTLTGNLYLSVRKWTGDEAYEVTISNDFYQSYIPFESEDY